MDKTDFDSWLKEEVDTKELKKDVERQEIKPFEDFIRNKEKIEKICSTVMKKGLPEYHNDEQLAEFLAFQLFNSKSKRIEAKIETAREGICYEDAVNNLHFAFSRLQDPKKTEKLKALGFRKEPWEILFYNELSICYAGLKNSSISRGYAEEAIEIIKKDGGYQRFQNDISRKADSEILKQSKFISSNLYDLFLTAVFNKAESERRAHLLLEAERDFKIIKDFVETSGILNFNYYSALLNLGILLADQSRGKESIELFDTILKKLRGKYDVRFWKAHMAKISSWIDQAEYSKAERGLKNFMTRMGDEQYVLKSEHMVTHQGFDALNYFASCNIENARNVHKIRKSDRKKLRIAKKVLEENIKEMQKREQKQSETTAYKHLGNIHQILEEYDEAIKNFLKCLSKGYTADLEEFNKQEPQENWVNSCEDLDALENIFYLLYDNSGKFKKAPLEKTLKTLGEKIERICEARSDLSKIGKITEITQEGIDNQGQKIIRNKIEDRLAKIDFKNGDETEEQRKKQRLLDEEEIKSRLDFNEKKFDKVLFGERNINVSHLAEVVVLRRWNSFSPGLFRRDAKGSLGGGYLVRINKKQLGIAGKDRIENIIIDPGYNFIQNFCGEGFSIIDIDTIIVTHSHLDHCANLGPIMDLLFQINKRNKRWNRNKEGEVKKRVTLCLSKGAYNKFSSYLKDWQEQLKDVIILENLPNHKWEPYKNLLKIEAHRTPHNDLGNVNAIGVKITINNNLKEIAIGFTGDTPYSPDIGKFFRGCDVLCVHLGSIKHQEIGYNEDIYHHDKKTPRKLSKEKQIDEVSKLYHGPHRANHLLFYGTEWLIDDFLKDNHEKDALVVVGEFGEELKYGLRRDLCKRIGKEKRVGCLPSDIGLYITILPDKLRKIRCNFCMHFVHPQDIETFSYGCEDSIQYICKSCDDTLTDLQKQALIENRITSN